MKHSCQIYCFDGQCSGSHFLMSYVKVFTFSKDFEVFGTVSYVYDPSCVKAFDS